MLSEFWKGLNNVFLLSVGSTHILTPRSLLEDIYNLGKQPMESFTIEEDKPWAVLVIHSSSQDRREQISTAFVTSYSIISHSLKSLSRENNKPIALHETFWGHFISKLCCAQFRLYITLTLTCAQSSWGIKAFLIVLNSFIKYRKLSNNMHHD